MAASYPDHFKAVYDHTSRDDDDQEMVRIYAGDGSEILLPITSVTIRDMEKIRTNMATSAEKVKRFSDAAGRLGPPAQRDGTFYTDDAFQEAMETAELTGYHRGIDAVLLLLKDRFSEAGTQRLLAQIKALHETEEG